MTLGLAVSKVVFGMTASALALVIAASIVDGTVGPVLVFGSACIVLYLGVRRVATRSEQYWIMTVVFSAFALRSALAAILVWRSLALGNGGFTTGDDIWYASAAGHLVRYLRGDPELPFVPPYWNGEYYLMTTYVFMESAIFWLFGQHVLNMNLVNSMAGALTVLLVADIGGRMFGRGASLVAASLLAVYPSIVLWSAVNLRDTMVILFIVVTLWALLRFHARPSIAWIVVAFLAVWAEEGLRVYIEGILLFVALLTVGVVFVVKGPARRIRWPLTAAALFTVLLIHSGLVSVVTQPVVTLGNIGDVRVGNQFGRTAFGIPSPQATPPSGGTPGVTAVATRAGAPAPTAVPTMASTPAPSVPPSAPAAVSASAAPTPTPTPSSRLLRGEVDGPTEISRNLAHLPVGAMHVLLAPLPWAARTASEFAAIPEMVVWYVILGASLVTLWTQRRRWEWLVPEVFFLGALLFALSLGEGNIGTLFRHRAMAVPAAILIASPTLAALGQRALSTRVARGLARGPATRLTRLLADAGPRTP